MILFGHKSYHSGEMSSVSYAVLTLATDPFEVFGSPSTRYMSFLIPQFYKGTTDKSISSCSNIMLANAHMI
jgi:hypothetical protein